VLKYLTLQYEPYQKSMACDEKSGDKSQLRNDLGDNRGTKIKREIPQLLIFNELRDLSVPRTGLEPARLAALAPETSASTIPPPGQSFLSEDVASLLMTHPFVGVKGFEPSTPCSQSRCANRTALRPESFAKVVLFF
jgi:hypothetical protein